MKNNLFIIAQSGWKYILYAFVAFWFFELFDLDFLSLIAFIAIVFFIIVFRNPERERVVLQTKGVTTPVDGVVSSIEEIQDSSEYAYRIEIDSSYLNVSVVRAVMDGNVEEIEEFKGCRLAKHSKLFLALNENMTIVFKDEDNHRVKVIHRLKRSFAPLDIDLVLKQKLLQGARYGVVVNGLTTLYLQKDTVPSVKVGEELYASQTLLATFN